MAEWLDRHGDVWKDIGDGMLETKETRPFSKDHVEKKWGPLLPLWSEDRPPLDAGMPARVWQLALSYGLHSDCIAAHHACTTCENTIMEAFETAYGSLATLDEVIGAIAHDVAADMRGTR